MKVVALAFALFATSQASESWKQEFTQSDIDKADIKTIWADWKSSFGRGYATREEDAERFSVFMSNLDGIVSHNSQDSSYKLKLNQFADLTSDEFRIKVHGHTGSCLKQKPQHLRQLSNNRTPFDKSKKVGANPDSVDWYVIFLLFFLCFGDFFFFFLFCFFFCVVFRTDNDGKSYVTPVKNQGDCGSCWAFSTTGSTECRYAIANGGTLNSLSEQQLVDCSYKEGNLGCDGGLMDDGFEYIISEGGLCSEELSELIK